MKQLRMAIVSAFAVSAMSLTGASPSFAQEPSGATHEHDAATAYQQLAEQVFTAPDPSKAFESLTDTEEQGLRDALMLDHIDLNVSPAENVDTGAVLRPSDSAELSTSEVGDALPAARFAGCWAVKNQGEGRSAINVHLFSFGHTVTVCVNRGKVRSVSVGDVWSQIYAVGWRNSRNPSSKTNNVRWEGRGRTQFFYALGSAGVDIQHAEPCIQTRLNANGRAYWGGTTCSLS